MPRFQLPTLDPQARTPLYLQLKAWLRDGIQRGAWPVGATVPSERSLSEQLAISRATTRQAVEELVNEGWLVKRQGLGTFVARPKLEQPLNGLRGFSETMREQGVEATSELLEARLLPAEDGPARALGLRPGEEIAVVRRLRFADAVPVMVEEAHLAHARVDGLLEHDLSGSLYELLRSEYRINLVLGYETLEVRPVEPREAATLQLDGRARADILYTERITGDERGTVEFTRRYARADRCRFRVELASGNADFTLRERKRSSEASAPRQG